jgi:DNA-binding NtrC family response regulator
MDEFRWQAFFQRATEPLFLLNRQRRLLFVNRAWESLTGLSLAAVRGLACSRRQSAVPSPMDAVTRLLCPPTEVLQGRTVHVRRKGLVGGTVWDVDYFPFNEGDTLLAILGRISATATLEVEDELLPDNLRSLRTHRASRFTLETLESEVLTVRRAEEQARVAADTDVGVLLIGEPGSGKQWLARAIHELSPRRDRPFAVVECDRLSATALDQILFGETGLIRSALAGTVYLRNAGSLPRDLQARLIEVMTEPTPTTPRLIGGAGSDLSSEARSLRVMEEFRCRLATLTIEVTPLRERLADLPELAEMFLQRALLRNPDETRREPPALTVEALDLLRSYAWPSNLRELFLVLSGALEKATAGRIGPSELPLSVEEDRSLPLTTLLEEAERRLIQLALRQAKGNKTKAAELLGIYKPLLYRRMTALGLKDESS